MRKKKKRSTYFGFQDWGTYTNETLIVVGLNHKQILSRLRRSSACKEIIEAFEKFDLDAHMKRLTPTGLCWFNEGRSLLYLPDWHNDWEHWDTLVHETYHLVHRCCVINKKMDGEDEAIAYQLEYLFRNIRRSLSDVESEKKKPV